MKRIYLLMILFVAAIGNAFAQRTIDLQVTMMAPTSTTVVNPGNGAFNIDVVVRNLGPDSLKSTTDSTYWYSTINGTKMTWNFGSSGTDWLRYNKGLKMNDTFHFTFNGVAFTSYSATKDTMRTLCWYSFPRGTKPSDTIKDPSTTNNSSCATFLFKKTSFPSSVGQTANATSYVMVFPNPAQNIVNVGFNMFTAADVKLVVLDMTGRVVMNIEKGEMNKGDHVMPIDTKSLPNGTYTYQLYLGKELSTSKFSI